MILEERERQEGFLKQRNSLDEERIEATVRDEIEWEDLKRWEKDEVFIRKFPDKFHLRPRG